MKTVCHGVSAHASQVDYCLGLATNPVIDMGLKEDSPAGNRAHEKDKHNETLNLTTSRIGSEQRGDEIIIIPNPASAVHTHTAAQAGSAFPPQDRTAQS